MFLSVLLQIIRKEVKAILNEEDIVDVSWSLHSSAWF